MRCIKIIGWIGTVLLMTTYLGNILGLLNAQELPYLLLNLFAAIFLGIRVYYDRNYSNVFLELFWGTVAIVGIIKYFI